MSKRPLLQNPVLRGSIAFLEHEGLSYADSDGNVSSTFVASDLPNWKSGSLSGKKMAWVGDSTTESLETVSQNLNYLVNNYMSAGGPLGGVTLQWFGSNGNTLSNFIADSPDGDGINDVIAANPDLIVLSYGINDVRLGATTEAQLITLLKSAVTQLLDELPTCDIILRMPNSFLTTDVSSLGYVVPNASAQTYSDRIRNAYRSLRNKWPNVVLYDSQTSRFPETCPATFSNMADQVHPSICNGYPGASTGGYAGIIDDIVAICGRKEPYNAGRAANAVSVSYADAHLTYARVVENGDYDLITEGPYVEQGSGFLRFTGNQLMISSIAAGDVVVMDGLSAFTLPAGATVLASGANIQLGNLGSGNPTYTQTRGNVQIWRHKYASNVANKPYLTNPAYPYKVRFYCNTGGSGYFRVETAPNGIKPSQFDFRTTDYLLHPVRGPISLASASYIPISADNWQISGLSGDFSVSGTQSQCFVVGPNPPLGARP